MSKLFNFYFHDELSKDIYDDRSGDLKKILNDFVLMVDVFVKVNGLINVGNPDKNSFWAAENNFNMLRTLLQFVGIEREDHMTILEDIALSIATKDYGLSVEERVDKIHDAWYKKVLLLREELQS